MLKNKPLSFQIWVTIAVLNSLVAVAGFAALLALLHFSGALRPEAMGRAVLLGVFQILLCVPILNMVTAKHIADKLTHPIYLVEEKMQQISRKEWQSPVVGVDRQDEIGNLVNTLVHMQNSLMRMEEDEEFFLQAVSHGLKTPIMVIKNCCQALRDGIYINDSKETTIGIIEEEAASLEDNVRKFLIINSFDYMLGKKSDFTEMQLKRMLRGIVDRFAVGNQHLTITLQGDECKIRGKAELIKTAIANIVENATRYAATFIEITLEPDRDDPQEYVMLNIKNDGDKIDDDMLALFFDKYHKGRKGNFGLGLYITKKIIEFHEGQVWVENDNDHVKFFLRMKRSCE